MPSDRAGAYWAGVDDNDMPGRGDSRAQRAAFRRPPLSRNALLAGVVAALGLGLALGFAAQPNLGPHLAKVPPMQPAARGLSETLDIEVTKPVVPPAPKAVGRLEVLPADMVRNAPPAAAAPRRPDPRPVDAWRRLDSSRYADDPAMPLPNEYEDVEEIAPG